MRNDRRIQRIVTASIQYGLKPTRGPTQIFYSLHVRFKGLNRHSHSLPFWFPCDSRLS